MLHLAACYCRFESADRTPKSSTAAGTWSGKGGYSSWEACVYGHQKAY